MRKIILSIIGTLGVLYFFIYMTYLSLQWKGYDMLRNRISELGAVESPFMLEMNVFGFMLAGLAIIVFAYNLHYSFEKNAFVDLSSLSVAMSGVLMILVGFFPCDNGCQGGSINNFFHDVVSSLLAVFMPLAAMFLSPALYRDKKSCRFWWVASLSLGVLSLLAAATAVLPWGEQVFGLLQRTGVVMIIMWVVSISLKIAMLQSRHYKEQRRQ